MKQETLEKVAENYKINIIKSGRSHRVEYTQQIKLDFIAGAKWQQEQDKNKYSEQEVYVLLLKHQSDYRSAVRSTSPLDWSFDVQSWFERFKKK